MRGIQLSPQSSVLITCVALATLAGCNVAGSLLHKVTPPPTTPAKYRLGVEPAVILVENYRNPSSSEIDAIQLTKLIASDLGSRRSAVLVDDNAVNALRDADPGKFRGMAIPAIGRAVGAKQVVYVDILQTSFETDIAGQMVKGSIEVTVRVVDAQTGQTRWPQDVQQGWPIGFESPYLVVDERTTQASLRRRLHDQVALSVGRLFRDWVPENEAIEEKKR